MGCSYIGMSIIFIILYILIGWIWQLPQTLIGFCFSWFFHNIHVGPAGFKYVLVKNSNLPCICLGEYLFIGNTDLTRFCYGRGILSRKFGPLFIPLISIPSIILILIGENWFMSFYGTKKSIKYGTKTDYKEKKILAI